MEYADDEIFIRISSRIPLKASGAPGAKQRSRLSKAQSVTDG